MKRTIALLMAVAVSLGLIGCAAQNQTAPALKLSSTTSSWICASVFNEPRLETDGASIM